MSQQVISYADLSIINNALRTISSNLSVINTDISSINFKQDQFESELEQLAQAFADFVAADLRQKALQLAETRVGNLRQDLQIKFGYYSEIRRMASGILQGVDTGVVGNDTLRYTTEEIMIKAPGYWLAPALITLSSWIRDDRSSAAKGLTESLNRDDYKATLFFMLVMRRLNRNEASLRWLERYFMHQNPHQLDREFIIILEAIATGSFLPASKQLMMKHVADWLNQLSQAENFVEEQINQWLNFFRAFGPPIEDRYVLLQKFATNFASLEASFIAVKAYEKLFAHFDQIISVSADLSVAVKDQLDQILSLLVTNFDDEEMPLQRQVRLNELVIEMDGDKKAAQAKMDTEEHIFKERVDFLQLLTNAAFNPEQSGATKVTQALAVSISQPWIVEAQETFTAQNRINVPTQVELAIDGFSVVTADGADELELLQKQGLFYDNQLALALKRLSSPLGEVVIGSLLAAGGLWSVFSLNVVLGLIFLVIGLTIAFNSLKSHKRARIKLIESHYERRQKGKEVLRGCIAEVVDYRQEYAAEDLKAELLRDLLKSIKPEDFSAISKDTVRSITLN